MAEAANLLSEGDIDVSNVRPAYEASLAHGESEAALTDALGWSRALLEEDGASVSGESTYRHMERMFARDGYPAFVLDAVSRHGAASLGVVGLACKTAPTVGEAIARHGRHQHLTNRTAVYEGAVREDGFVIEERRDDPCLGSQLISDYTMLVAQHLLSTLGGSALRPRLVRSRRESLSSEERATLERWLDAPIETGHACAAIVYDAAVWSAPVPTADPELRAYFDAILERATPGQPEEPGIVREVRVALRETMARGTPSVAEVGRALGIGERTLQRRLAAEGTSFARTLESTRKALAEAYLSDPSLTLAEVAYLLGYGEQPSFYRAFRRWFDTTPDAFRKAR